MTWTPADRSREIKNLHAAADRFDTAEHDARRTAEDATAYPAERALAARLITAHRASAADARAVAHALAEGADPTELGYR
jgi:hypothetical protein